MPGHFDLIQELLQLIPSNRWDEVKATMVEYLVDIMPSDVLIKLTKDPCGFDKAELILVDYYRNKVSNQKLLSDCIEIIGIEDTVMLLDRLNLNQFNIPDCTPCSVEEP